MSLKARVRLLEVVVLIQSCLTIWLLLSLPGETATVFDSIETKEVIVKDNDGLVRAKIGTQSYTKNGLRGPAAGVFLYGYDSSKPSVSLVSAGILGGSELILRDDSDQKIRLSTSLEEYAIIETANRASKVLLGVYQGGGTINGISLHQNSFDLNAELTDKGQLELSLSHRLKEVFKKTFPGKPVPGS